MQEKNTNNVLKAQPIAYECDLFSSATRLGGVLLHRHPSKGENDLIYLRWKKSDQKNRALKLPLNTIGCAPCCALQPSSRFWLICIKLCVSEEVGARLHVPVPEFQHRAGLTFDSSKGWKPPCSHVGHHVTHASLGGMKPNDANPSIIQGHPVNRLSFWNINWRTLSAAVSLIECSRWTYWNLGDLIYSPAYLFHPIVIQSFFSHSRSQLSLNHCVSTSP